jgi:hypothetical protein
VKTAASLVTKDLRRDTKYLVTILFLLPIVLQRFFIGGVSGGYDSYIGVSLNFVGYIINFGFAVTLLLSGANKTSNSKHFIVTILFFVSILQISYSSYVFNLPFYNMFFVLARALLWVIAVYAYADNYLDLEVFVQAFLDTILWACLFILGCYLVYLTTNIPFGVNIEKGLGRAHGTFSEPSTLACVLPAFIFVNFKRRQFWAVFIGLITLYASASTIASSVFVLMAFMYLIHRSSMATYTYILAIVMLAVLITTNLGAASAGSLYSLANYFSEFLNNYVAEGLFRTYTFDRIPIAISELADYLGSNVAVDVSESGSLARLLGAYQMLNNMENDGALWFGYGLSVYGYVANALFKSALDFGLYPYLVSSFGIIAGTVLIFVFGIRVASWGRIDPNIFLIFSGSLIGTIYNSGGGIMAYTLPLLAFIASKPNIVTSTQR